MHRSSAMVTATNQTTAVLRMFNYIGLSEMGQWCRLYKWFSGIKIVSIVYMQLYVKKIMAIYCYLTDLNRHVMMDNLGEDPVRVVAEQFFNGNADHFTCVLPLFIRFLK